MKRRHLQIGLLWALSLTAQATATELKYPELSKRGFNQLETLSRDLARSCPSEQCLLVFIGRSSTLVAAYLEAFQLANAVSIPISGVMRIADDRLDVAEARFKSEVLSKFLQPRLAQVKKIQIVDQVNSGTSLALVSIWIQRFLSHAPATRSIAVQALGYGGALNPKAQRLFSEAGLDYNSIPSSVSGGRAGDLFHLTRQSMAEPYAPYGEWNPISTQSSPEDQRLLRRPYPYRDSRSSTISHYASYEDLVSWLKSPHLAERLPSGTAEDCRFWLQ